jgi:hypothetical protein
MGMLMYALHAEIRGVFAKFLFFYSMRENVPHRIIDQGIANALLQHRTPIEDAVRNVIRSACSW